MLVEMFGKHCDSVLYTLKYHVLDDMLEGIRRFEKLTVLGRQSIREFECAHQAPVQKNFTKKTDNSDGNNRRGGEKLREGSIIRDEGG